jgi:hypothetical protein
MVTPEDSDADQECASCPAGSECLTQPCTACTPCKAGHYKESASKERCSVCTSNTYNEKSGSSSVNDCTPCSTNAVTNGTARTSKSDCVCSSSTYPTEPQGSNARTCTTCPFGARCLDQTCALNAGDLVCVDSGKRIVGNWTRDDTTGEYHLRSCDAGHELVNKLAGSTEFDHNSQQCRPCASPSQYIMDPNFPNFDACTACPRGLICQGTAEYTPVVSGSTWQAVDGTLKLQSCPGGYKMVTPVTPEDDRDQECASCAAGSECVTQPCTACTPCEAGHYKESIGAAVCSPCPIGRYNAEPGAASINQCLLCPSGASTDQQGSTSYDQCKCNVQRYVGVNADGALSCEVCPAGAECPDKSCAFHLSTVSPTCPGSSDSIVGTWKLDNADGKYKVTSCPAGYKFTTEECIRCQVCLTAGDWCSRADYILNSNSTDSACQVCPEGAECNGASLRTKNNLQGASWVIEGDRYSLKSCPTGHRLVNNLGYESQKCEPCGASEYILKSDDPSYQCLPCPARL